MLQIVNKIFPRVDHITLTVKDFQQSKVLYNELFANYLGGEIVLDDFDVFGVRFASNFMIEIVPEKPEFKDSKFNRYQVGLHHFALELENKEIIDKVYSKLLEMKLEILDAPKFYPEYDEGYYAVFFQDLNGFKIEFMCYDK